jgi:hypothetical protein
MMGRLRDPKDGERERELGGQDLVLCERRKDRRGTNRRKGLR